MIKSVFCASDHLLRHKWNTSILIDSVDRVLLIDTLPPFPHPLGG